MRVLTVVFGLSKGGTERAAAVFAAGYARRGHDSILLSSEGRVRTAYLSEHDVRVLDANNPEWKAVLEDWKPEVVHLHSHGLPDALVTEIANLCSAATLVETNVFSRPSPWESRLKYSFQLGQHATALYVSRGGRAEITRLISYPLDDASFLPPSDSWSMRRQARDRLGLAAEGVVVGRVGQDFMGKWSHRYVDTFSELADLPGAQFLLINPPAELQARLANEKSVAARIRVIDCIEDDEALRDAYLAMDVLLHIADQGESFGYAIAEAISVGTPVVALATPWGDNTQSEIIRTGLNGAIVCQPSALSAATRWALTHPWSSQKMSRDVHDRFGVSTTIAKVEALFADPSSPYVLNPWSSKQIVAFDRIPFLDKILLRLLFRNAAAPIRAALRRKTKSRVASSSRG